MKLLKPLVIFSALSPLSVMGMEALQDESLSGVTGQEGVDVAIALTANWDNIYFDTDGNRFNLGNIAIDTDSRGVDGSSNEPFYMSMDAVSSGRRKGLEMAIWNVNSVDFTIRDVSLTAVDTNGAETARDVYGTLGLENMSFNGGYADVALLGIPGVGQQGVFTEVTLPQGTTLDFTINDFQNAAGDYVDAAAATQGGELRATLELNDFYVGQSFDLVENADGTTGMKMIFSGMHASMDITNISAGNPHHANARQGSYGRVVIDNLNMTRGYVQVNALD